MEPQPGDVWLVQRDEAEDEPPTIAQYGEWDNGDGYWVYFGTEWIDRVKDREIKVQPVSLIYRKEITS